MNFKVYILLLISIVSTFLYQFTLPIVDEIDYISLLSEGIISLSVFITIVILLKITGIKNLINNYIIIGFYFILVGMFNDTLDEVFYHSNSYTAIFEDSTLLIGFISLLIGINNFYKEFLKINEELKQKATVDSLTKVFNRAKIDEYLPFELDRFKRYQHSFGLILLDIDFFKSVNDNFGHLVGDEALVNFASLIKNSIRNTDTICRWGGEEFLVVCPKTSEDDIIRIAENLRKKIENTKILEQTTITASIGTTICMSNDSIDSLINRVDEAMYEAKQTGRNKVCCK